MAALQSPHGMISLVFLAVLVVAFDVGNFANAFVPCLNQHQHAHATAGFFYGISAKHFRVPTATFAAEKDTETTTYDLAVVGGGVVGVQAALAAALTPYNKKVVLIDAPSASGALMAPPTDDDMDINLSPRAEMEDLSLGGPTGLFGKALRDTSKRIKVSTLRGMGLRDDSVWNEIINLCIDLARSNAQDIQRQMEMAGIDYVQGYASFHETDTESLTVVSGGGPCDSEKEKSTNQINASKILLATGSKPFLPDGIPFDGKRIFDSDSINSLTYLPKSIAITGSGIIAIEYAKIFRNLGAEVTLIIRDLIPRKALEKIGLDSE